MFTVIVLVLVALILMAKSKLVAAGDVTIGINGEEDKAIHTPAGGSCWGPWRPMASSSPLLVAVAAPAASAVARYSPVGVRCCPPS